MTYCSGTLSLAVLEILVHVDPHDLPDDMMAISAQIPDNMIHSLPLSQLPQNWRQIDPSPYSLAKLGKQWLDHSESPALAVPSSIIPEEFNYLLNPDHPDFEQIALQTPKSFQFDPRLGVGS